MTQVETWVNDKLHDILGISDKYIAQYLIGLAKKSSSADEYIEKLRDTGTVEIDQNMVNFSQELWHKIPHAAVKEKASRVHERTIIEQQQKNSSYQLISDDDDDDDDYVHPIKKQKNEKRSRHIRKRKQEESSSSEDEPAAEKETVRQTEDSEDEYDQMENERLRDLEERDAFAGRLKNKDKDKTRHIMSKTEKKAFEEAQKRLKMENDDQKKVVPELRKKSRRDYLKKRQVDKLDEMEGDIIDEEYLFVDQKLTKKEKQDLEYKKTVLKLAKEHRDAKQIEKVNRYYIPKDDEKPQDK